MCGRFAPSTHVGLTVTLKETDCGCSYVSITNSYSTVGIKSRAGRNWTCISLEVSVKYIDVESFNYFDQGVNDREKDIVTISYDV